MSLRPEDLTFGLAEDLSEGEIVTIDIAIPAATIRLMGVLIDTEAVIRVEEAHIVVVGRPKVLSRQLIRGLARIVLERTEYDEVIIAGAARTSGANPGHRPPVFRFSSRGGS